MSENKEKLNIYYIPKNFIDSGYVFRGKFRTRNFIEAVVLALPVLAVFAVGWKMFDWPIQSTISVCVILTGAVFLLVVNGINGDSVLQFVQRFFDFKKNRRISKYNGRLKLEKLEPDYLVRERGSLPREKLQGVITNVKNALLDDDGNPISTDITDEHLIVYFRDDEGIVEKPRQLKTRAELKKEEKEAKKKAKEEHKRKLQEIKQLPRKERSAARRELRAAEKAKAAENKLQQERERQRIDKAVKEATELAAKNKKAMADAERARKALEKEAAKKEKADAKAARKEEKRKARQGKHSKKPGENAKKVSSPGAEAPLAERPAEDAGTLKENSIGVEEEAMGTQQALACVPTMPAVPKKVYVDEADEETAYHSGAERLDTDVSGMRTVRFVPRAQTPFLIAGAAEEDGRPAEIIEKSEDDDNGED